MRQRQAVALHAEAGGPRFSARFWKRWGQVAGPGAGDSQAPVPKAGHAHDAACPMCLVQAQGAAPLPTWSGWAVGTEAGRAHAAIVKAIPIQAAG